MKKIFILIILISLINISYAQIYSPNNFYSSNLFIYNPARTGENEQLSAFIDYRNNLKSIKDAPKLAILGVHTPIYKKMSIGGFLKSEKLGLFENNYLHLDYSYKTPITKNQTIAFGINGGLIKNNINTDNLVVADPDDPSLNNLNSKLNYFAGAGLAYTFKEFEFDFSLPSIYKTNSDIFIKYWTYASYNFYNKTKKWKFKPSASATYSNNSEIAIDVNLMTVYDEFIWLQATTKSNKSFVVSVGVNYGKFGIGYAYETNPIEVSAFGGASHEIMLSYGLNKLKPTEIIIPADTTEEYRLSRKINGQTYEEYVRANNYGFYNDMLELTDSLHEEKVKEDNAEKARQDSIRLAELEKQRKAKEDSIRLAEQERLKKLREDSIRRAHALRHLSQKEMEILKIGVHFQKGSSRLDAKSRQYLNKVANLLKKNRKIKIQITGFTCDLGSDEINRKYSHDRAESVRRYLQARGVSRSQITTDAKADAEPIVPNTSEENRKLNRRVAFSVIRE